MAEQSEADTDSIGTLRRRYADGELTEAEFERRLKRLVNCHGVKPRGLSVDSRSNCVMQ